MTTYDLICVGSGPAGEKAATQAAYYGHRAVIIERQARPGGAMVNTGTIPSKALRETALLCSAFHRRPIPGVEYRIDHHMSVPRFMARRHLIEQQEHDRIESSMDRHGIDIIHGHGRVVDANTVVVESANGATREVKGKNILLATGSSPYRPEHLPFDHPGVVDADGVLNLGKIPDSMIIVGGGVIGCEYASIFAEIDVQVTLVHPHDAVLPFLDADCRDHLVAAMVTRGVEMRLGVTVENVEPLPDGRLRVLGSGPPLETDVVLWAAGRTPNTADLGLDTVDVKTDKRGRILVDDSFCTNVPSIYAAGDVIGFPALAATSMEQGRIATCNMFGLDFKTKLAETIPLGIYTIPGISSVGATEAEAVTAGRDIVVGTAPYRNNARGRMLGDETGMIKCVFDRETGALIGATIVGEQATELIHLAQTLIATGEGIDHLINTCFNYPSLAEVYKYAAYAALQVKAKSTARAA